MVTDKSDMGFELRFSDSMGSIAQLLTHTVYLINAFFPFYTVHSFYCALLNLTYKYASSIILFSIKDKYNKWILFLAQSLTNWVIGKAFNLYVPHFPYL